MRIVQLSRRRRLVGTAIALALAASVLSLLINRPPAAAAAAPTWSTVSPAASPPPLAYASMAYDSDNATLVLFGGQTASGPLSSTTWVWNGSVWSRSTSAVPARAHASMAFDPQLHQLILFGGVGAGGQLLNDTWAWNGANWYPVGGTGQEPSPREGAGLAYDANAQLILFGGTTSAAGTTALGTTTLGDTWVWTGSAWAQQNVGAPSARTDAALDWDEQTGQTLLFGGSSTPTGASAAALLAETWVYGGGSWGPVAPPTSPPATADAGVADDPDLGGLVVIGGSTPAGSSDATWLWNGLTWASLATVGSPGAREGAVAAYDAAAHQLVLFGGVNAAGATLGDTVILTPQPPSTASPSPVPSPATTTPSLPSAGTTSTTTAIRSGGGSAHSVPAASTTTSTVATGAGRAPRAATQTLRPGGLMTLRGDGFSAGATVTITFHSTPARVGLVSADALGQFEATVAVPTDATAGLHHFEASGAGASGTELLLVTPVEVVVAAVHHSTVLRTLALVALSVALPAGCWLVMEIRDRRRLRLRV